MNINISVVIPVFNEEQHITSCLDSLAKQQIKPDEIIIVDNNSTDQSMKLAKKYPVRIVSEKKQGMIYARNTGFNSVFYEIIAKCDADTIVPADWLKRIKDNFEKGKIDALSGPIYFNDLPLVSESTLPTRVYAQFMKTIQRHETLLGPNLALTKKIWEKIKNEVCLDDKKVHEDIDLAIHIKKHHGRIKFDPELKVYTSGRRIKNNPLSFFVEYPIRVLKTLKSHNY